MMSPRIGFTGLMIDRADNLRAFSDRIAELAARDEALLMRLAGIEPLLTDEGALSWSAARDHGEASELLFLGMAEDRPLFAPLQSPENAAAPRNMFSLVGRLSPEDAALWGVAHSLIGWHRRSRFCGSCGSATFPMRAGWGRRCTSCAAEHFPRVDPVVIMLAEFEGKVLLGRQPAFPAGRYSALAGFVEPGESVEEAVARELKEEAGVVARNVRYVSSQPWPFPGQLMIGCIADAHSGEIRLDPTELEEAIWVDRAGVAAALEAAPNAPFVAPPSFAIAYSLLAHWLKSGAKG